MTPNTIAQISTKVVMTSDFMGTFSTSKWEYDTGPDRFFGGGGNNWDGCDNWGRWIRMLSTGNVHGTRYKTLLFLPLTSSYWRLSTVLTRTLYAFRSHICLGILDRFCHRLNTPCHRLDSSWETGKFGKQILKSLTTQDVPDQQLDFHVQQTIQGTSTQDLDPHTCADNVHTSVLPHETMTIELGENPTRTLTWRSLAYLNHILREYMMHTQHTLSSQGLQENMYWYTSYTLWTHTHT